LADEMQVEAVYRVCSLRWQHSCPG